MMMVNLSEAVVYAIQPNLRHAAGALALFQEDAINSGNSKLLMVFVGIAAVALLGQFVAILVIAVGAMKAQKRITKLAEEAHAMAMPLIMKSQTLLEELGPKISDITENVKHISFVVRDKVEEFEPTISAANVTLREANDTAQDVNRRARGQVVRVDGMITSALNSVAELAGTIHHSVRVPIREVAGVVTGLKAGLDTLIGRMQHIRPGVASMRAVPVAPVRDQAVSPVGTGMGIAGQGTGASSKAASAGAPAAGAAGAHEGEYKKDRADMHDLGL